MGAYGQGVYGLGTYGIGAGAPVFTGDVRDDFDNGNVDNPPWVDVAGASEAGSTLTIPCTGSYGHVTSAAGLDMRGSQVAVSVLETPTAGLVGIAPVADITSTVSQLRQGSLTGPRMVLAGIALWGIQDTIVGPSPLGDQWLAARDQIAATLRSWGVNYVRIRVWADYWNGLGATDQAAYVAKAVAWRDAMKAQGILTCFCWWDPLDGAFSGALWATNYNRSFALMAAIINAIGVNDPWTFVEPGNEPNNMTADAWYAAMAATITYLRSTLGYQNLLVIDPNAWAHTWDDTRFTNLENLDATLTASGRANLIFAWHEYANNYSGQTWNTSTFTANTGGSSQKHPYFMGEWGPKNGSLADNVPWASDAATAIAALPATRTNFCGGSAFIFGNWYDNNATTTADFTTTTTWGTAAKTNFYANVGGTRPQQSTTQAVVQIKDAADNRLEMLVEADASGAQVLTMRQQVGAPSDVTIPYDPAAHRWWRMTETSGTITWATSPDSSTWTTRRTAAAGITTSAVSVGLLSGYWGAAPASPGSAQFGAINILTEQVVGVPSAGTVADLLCFVSFDRDPLDCSLASGNDATMEGANSWDHANANTVDVIAGGIVHAGTGATQLTRTGTTGSLQEFWQSPVGSVTADRWYGALLYLRPDSTARTAQLTMTFQTAASGTLTAVTSTVPEMVGQWWPVMVVGLAPIGVSRLRVDLTIAGVAVDEVHRYDTFTCDYLGTLLGPGRVRDHSWKRGRNDELGQVQASTCSVTLKNQDGYLTPDGTTAPSPYLGNVDSGRRLVILRRVNGVIYPEWAGTTETWQQTIHPSGRWSEVQVQATDAFGWFGRPLLPPLPAEIMRDAPDTYFRLAEEKGSTRAGSIAGDGGVLTLATSKYGSLGTDFGGDNAAIVLDTGKTADDGQTWLDLNPSAIINGAGNVLDLSAVPAANPYVTTGGFNGWTMEIWAQLPANPPPETRVLFRTARYGGGYEYHSGIQVQHDVDSGITVHSPTATLLTSQYGWLGTTVPIVLAWSPTGGAWGTLAMRIAGDADVQSVSLSTSPYTNGIPDRIWVGGYYQSGIRNLQYAWRTRIAHIAFWKRALTGSRVLAHSVVGRSGNFSGESDGNRIGGISDLVGWPTAWTRVDVGLSEMMNRSWSQTTALSQIQEIAKQASAVVYIDGAGKLTMRNRHFRVNAPVKATFRTADGTPITARDFQPKKDSQFIENSIRVTRTKGATTVASDAVSVRRYGLSPADDLEVAVTSNEEAVALGQWRVATRKDNKARVASLVLQPGARPALWPIVLTLEVGDRVSVQGLPGLAPWQSLDAFVESIESRADGGPRNTSYTLGLSPWSAALHKMGQLDTGTDLSLLGAADCQLGWY
jgi:hypothetical protein